MDEFLAATRKLMNGAERAELANYLVYQSTVGVVVPGTGVVCKLRCGLEGCGKRGGAWVMIYHYHDMEMPLYLLTAYADGPDAAAVRHSFRFQHQCPAPLGAGKASPRRPNACSLPVIDREPKTVEKSLRIA
jgi:hypothetical protein